MIPAYEVVGVGDADVDMYLDVPHIPAHDEKVLATRAAIYPGGMVANFLVALRRLGTSCCFHGPVGDDEFGRIVRADLADHGVALEGLVIKPGGRTYYCVVLLDGSGEKSLVVAPTDCSFPGPEDIDPAIIAQARHLHTTGTRPDTALLAARVAKQHDLDVSLDLEPAELADAGQLHELLGLTNLLFVNHRALERLTSPGLSTPDAVATLLAHGPQIVCITAGAAGAWVGTRDGVRHIPAFQVVTADTTGAGDTFAAAFVYGHRAGWSPVASARFAAAAAAVAVGHRGGHGGVPNREEVQSFLAARPILRTLREESSEGAWRILP